METPERAAAPPPPTVDPLRAFDGALAWIAREHPGDKQAARDARRDKALRLANDVFAGEDGRELLDGAIEVLERRTLRRVVARPSSRNFVAVDAPAGAAAGGRYCVFDDFCSCLAFARAAALAPTPAICKHMLAARLAPLVDCIEEKEIADDQYHAHLSCFYPSLA